MWNSSLMLDFMIYVFTVGDATMPSKNDFLLDLVE